MEPALKRLRLLGGNYTVDEENPDYVAAKQKQQQKFKSTWETLFQKFGSMHESMSDEIDFVDNSIVKDRGHLRRLQRQAKRSEIGMLMKTHGLITGGDDEDGEAEELENNEDSEDELASAQSRKKTRERPDAHRNQTNAELRPVDATPASKALVSSPMPRAVPTQNHTMTLLQYLPPAETPEGRQARSALQQLLGQQQLSSTILQTPGNSCAVATDAIAPATDPKWYFPALPIDAVSVPGSQSSPIPALTHTPVPAARRPIPGFQKRATEKLAGSHKVVRSRITQIQKENVSPSSDRLDTPDPLAVHEEETEVMVPAIKTEEFDEDGTETVAVGERSESRQHFEVEESVLERGTLALREHQQSAVSNHPLTPTSLDREDIEKTAGLDQRTDDEAEQPDVEFDKDDRDLLSLDGEETEEEMLLQDDPAIENSSPAPEDILPSIEVPHIVEEESVSIAATTFDAPSPSTIVVPMETNDDVDIAISSPVVSRKRKREVEVIPRQQEPEKEGDVDKMADIELASFKCESCQKSFKSAVWLKRHHAFPPKDHPGAGVHQEPAQETTRTPIKAPKTPMIKRETASPSRIDFLFRTPFTPKVTPLAAGKQSGAKSTSKLSRKDFLKQVKQSWKKKPASSSKGYAKPRGFFDTPVRKARMADADSEDELAM